jgi:predicted YcjX-like family ATPase
MSFKRQIAIVGLFNSGKTVLLTSLLHHLQHHDPERFHVESRKKKKNDDDLISITRAELVDSRLPIGFEPFPFDAYRTSLVENGKWPRKTSDCYAARCVFNYSDSGRKYDLTFLDVPGERFADMAMGGRTYEAWSDKILSDMKVSQASRAHIEVYEKHLSDLEDQQEINQEYKLLLGNLLKMKRPMISPSTFLLDPNGEQPKDEQSIEEWSTERFSGLSKGKEFAPLPKNIRNVHPEIVKNFRKHFKNYKKKFLMPIFSNFCESHRVIVAVDIPGLLSDTNHRFNDMHKMLTPMFNAMRDDSPWWWQKLKNSGNPIRKRKVVSRIALVCTKLDQVHHNDGGVQTTNLEKLAKKMLGKEIGDVVRKWKPIGCAAIASTDPVENGALGFPMYNEKKEELPFPSRGDKPFFIKTSKLDRKMREEWKAGDFHFPEVHAQVPSVINIPPRQIGLDQVFNYLMQEDPFE